MDLNSLYNIAEKENIKIYDWQIEDVDGMYLNYQNINAIALNYDRLGTYIDEKCTLAHELGHHFSGFTYKVDSAPLITDKAEYKANQWSFITLVPLNKLKKLIKKQSFLLMPILLNTLLCTQTLCSFSMTLKHLTATKQ